MNKAYTTVRCALCLLMLAGCDNTYTPSLHHQADASTGSRLQGTDTGVNPSGSIGGAPSIKPHGHAASD